MAAAAAMALCLATAGCAAFDRAFGKREAVVQFQPNTPAARGPSAPWVNPRTGWRY